MKIKVGRGWLIGSVIGLWSGPGFGGSPVGTNFNYQGQLKQGGMPVNGQVDLQFRLCDDDMAACVPGTLVALNNVQVVSGLFSATLDFGPGAFVDEERWLQVAVRSPAGGGSFTTLDPRQRLTAVPYAAYAVAGGSISLNRAYNHDGPGAGRQINAANGPVNIFGLGAGELTAAGGGLFVSGVEIGANVAMDSNEIMARSNGAPSELFINDEGGDVFMIRNGLGNVGIGEPEPGAKLHVRGGTETQPSGGGILVLGNTVLSNLSLDSNEIMARNNGAVATLALNPSGGNVNLIQAGDGNVGIGTTGASAKLHVNRGTDAEPGSGGYLVLGAADGLNVALDNNEIMARDNGQTSTLYLNADGGDVVFGGAIDIGYQIVNVSDGSFPTLASCPAGKRVIGGGCDCGADAVQQSRPTSNGTAWVCVCDDASPAAYAICASVK
jgi:hypothetical protein